MVDCSLHARGVVGSNPVECAYTFSELKLEFVSVGRRVPMNNSFRKTKGCL